jgi:hypothetical protein
LPGPDYVDGYCTAGCDTDADCSAGGHCTAFPGDGGTTVNLCTADCSTDAECRAGYACYDRDGNGESECWLAATGTGAVGSACTFIWQCSGDENGACLTEADGFRQGYCTQVCSATMPCPTGSHCGVTDTATGDGICLADCTTGSCRLEGAGYVCSDIDGDTASECFHGGTGVIGSPCAQTWDCTPDWNALCIPEDPSGRFPGGYCTVLCGGTCPTGSTCVGIFTDGSAACLDNCSGTGMGDCRSDYMCTALDSSASVCYDDGT